MFTLLCASLWVRCNFGGLRLSSSRSLGRLDSLTLLRHLKGSLLLHHLIRLDQARSLRCWLQKSIASLGLLNLQARVEPSARMIRSSLIGWWHNDLGAILQVSVLTFGVPHDLVDFSKITCQLDGVAIGLFMVSRRSLLLSSGHVGFNLARLNLDWSSGAIVRADLLLL